MSSGDSIPHGNNIVKKLERPSEGFNSIWEFILSLCPMLNCLGLLNVD